MVGFANAEASTTLKADIPLGAIVMETTTVIGFAMGRQVLIDAGSPIEEVNIIAGFGSILLQYPCRYAHKAGVLITMPSLHPTTIGPPPTTPNPWLALNKYYPM